METVRVQVYVAWWFTWLYVPGLMTLAALGGTPDWSKVDRMLTRAVRVKLVPVKSEVQA